MIDGNKAYNQILIGYTVKATNDFDFGIDGKAFNSDIPMIYTLIDHVEYVIEGRPAFNMEDKVSWGFTSKTAGLYTIS